MINYSIAIIREKEVVLVSDLSEVGYWDKRDSLILENTRIYFRNFHSEKSFSFFDPSAEDYFLLLQGDRVLYDFSWEVSKISKTTDLSQYRETPRKNWRGNYLVGDILTLKRTSPRTVAIFQKPIAYVEAPENTIFKFERKIL